MITHARLVNYAACYSSLTLTNPSFSRCEYDGGVILMLTLRVRIPPSYYAARSASLRSSSLARGERGCAQPYGVYPAPRIEGYPLPCTWLPEASSGYPGHSRAIVRCYSPNSPCRTYRNSPVPRVRRITDCTCRFRLPRGNSITFHMPHSANAHVSTFFAP